MSAEAAAALIGSGTTVGMSGFTGSGYPKAVPLALAARIEANRAAGNPFRLRVWTRSEEHTSDLHSLIRLSYAFFCFTYKTSTFLSLDVSTPGKLSYPTCLNRTLIHT